MLTIRQWLDAEGFDWSTGTVVVDVVRFQVWPDGACAGYDPGVFGQIPQGVLDLPLNDWGLPGGAAHMNDKFRIHAIDKRKHYMIQNDATGLRIGTLERTKCDSAFSIFREPPIQIA